MHIETLYSASKPIVLSHFFRVGAKIVARSQITASSKIEASSKIDASSKIGPSSKIVVFYLISFYIAPSHHKLIIKMHSAATRTVLSQVLQCTREIGPNLLPAVKLLQAVKIVPAVNIDASSKIATSIKIAASIKNASS